MEDVKLTWLETISVGAIGQFPFFLPCLAFLPDRDELVVVLFTR